ncbi:MAG: hypothetical protein K8S62_13705 [Candidatus Sabulitectum sp.]|nr:hypothetical protein [Candidatus Sabulitectum sp.]
MDTCTKITLAGSVLLTLSAPAATAQTTEIRAILESDDWEALRAIWKLVNGVKPNPGYRNFPIATEKGDSLRAAVDRLFTDADIEDPRLETALNLVQRVTSTRIIRMSRINPSMLTRVRPPWAVTVQEGLLFNFEDRITTLTSLVEENEITAVEFIAARDTLLERAVTWALLDILPQVQSSADYDYYGWSVEEMDTDAVLARLDLSYRAALDTLKKREPGENIEYLQLAVRQHEEFLQEYTEFQLAIPVLRILLTDLMEAGM